MPIEKISFHIMTETTLFEKYEYRFNDQYRFNTATEEALLFLMYAPNMNNEIIALLDICFYLFPKKSIILIDDNRYSYKTNDRIVEYKRAFGKNNLLELKADMLCKVKIIDGDKILFVDCSMPNILSKTTISTIVDVSHAKGHLYIELLDNDGYVGTDCAINFDNGFPELRGVNFPIRLFFGSLLDGSRFIAFQGKFDGINRIIDALGLTTIKLQSIPENIINNITHFLPIPFYLSSSSIVQTSVERT